MRTSNNSSFLPKTEMKGKEKGEREEETLIKKELSATP